MNRSFLSAFWHNVLAVAIVRVCICASAFASIAVLPSMLFAQYIPKSLTESRAPMQTNVQTGQNGQPAQATPIPRAIPMFDLGPGGKLVVKDEAFKAASSLLEPNSLPWFDALGKYLTERPDLEVEIRGHASAEGDAQANYKLSALRAEAAKTYICEKFRLAPERIHTRGMGDTNPLTSNTTEVGRSQNRRVEIIGLSSATNRILTTETGKAAEGDGKITFLQNKVQLRAPWELDFHAAKMTDAVYEYHRINTAENSRAEITFNDNSKIQVYENTSMIIYSPNKDRTGGKPQENIKLFNGNLFLKFNGQGTNNGKFSVKTENSEITLDTSSAKIAVDSNKRATVSVFGGEATVTMKDSVRGDSAITVQENFGFSMQGNVATVRHIPDMPRLLVPDTTLASLLVLPSPVLFRWQTPFKGLLTRLEVSNDAAFTKIVFRQVFQRADSVSMPLDSGVYYFRLASIDALGIESRPIEGMVSVGGSGPKIVFHIVGFLLFLLAAALTWVSLLVNTPFQAQYINSWVVENSALHFNVTTDKQTLFYRMWKYTIEHRSLLLVMRSLAAVFTLLAVFIVW
jgi:outer membrane protein OmpA-like peptidoglycan-associated protein